MSSFTATTREQESECCICLETIGNKNNCVTPCGHAFCFNCVTRALTINNTCPMCREVLVEIPEEDEDDDSDYEDEEEEDEDEDEDEDEEEDENVGDENIEEITERFLKLGYTTLDIVSMMTGRYKRSDPKNSKAYIKKMIQDFENIIDDVDNEEDERIQMEEQDK
jgi:hypothetical protein